MRPKLVQFYHCLQDDKKRWGNFLKLGELIGFGEPEKVEFSKKTVFFVVVGLLVYNSTHLCSRRCLFLILQGG